MSVDPSSARSRILLAASDLFYEQGFKATGVNEIIKRASVAKATFYAHFESKDLLCHEYLSNRERLEITEIKQSIDVAATPLGKYLALARLIEPYVAATSHRGCGFLNLAAEIPDIENPLRKIGIEHYNSLLQLLTDATEELVASDVSKYGHLSSGKVAIKYLTLIAGGMALSEVYGEQWPVAGLPEAVLELVS